MNTDTFTIKFFKANFLYLAFLIFSPSLLFSENGFWQLTCPDDLVVQLDPKKCNQAVLFDSLVWSSSEPISDTTFFPASGTFFGIGTAMVTLGVTTVSGQFEVCTFHIIVEEFLPSSLDCFPSVQVSLSGLCERIFLPSILMWPDSVGCINNYLAGRIDANGNVIDPIISAADIGQPVVAVAQHLNGTLQCMTEIIVTGGIPPSITCPPDLTIACNTPLLPSITGRPDTSGCFENIAISYFDHTTVTQCSDTIGFQTNRTWTSVDPFGNEDVCHQILTGIRVNLSLVEFPGDYDGTDNPPLSCSDGLTWQEVADPVFTGKPLLGGYPPNVNQTCDISVNFLDMPTNICGAAYNIQRIWTVVNVCDPSEEVKDTQYIKILDQLPPVFTIPDTFFASIDMRCFDSLFLPEINIIQECSGFDVEIRTPWDTLFTNGGWTPIELTIGSYPIIYGVTDYCGYFSFATAVLVVEDENLVACPPTVAIDCDFYYSTIAPAIGLDDFDVLNGLGVPEYHGNCEFTFSETDSISVDGCGVGVLIRTLTPDSMNVDGCVQVVNVTHVSNFSVLFPADLTICTSPLMANLGAPVLSGVSCENIVTNSTDAIVPSGVAGCYTIKRTWLVNNACSYNGTNNDDDTQLGVLNFMDGGDGIIYHVQTILVNDRPGPSFPDNCGFPDLHVFQNSCEITVTVPTPEVEGCGNIELSISGDLGNVMGENVNLTPGVYEMTFTAIDECGKIGVCHNEFEVLDTVGPVALCKQNIIVEMMVTDPPFVEVWASDFNNGSFDNCGGILNIYFLEEDSLVLGTVFDDCCNDIGPHLLTVVVEDQYGNQSSCTASLVIQMNMGMCDCNEFIAGNISTEAGVGINNVAVGIEEANGFSIDINTDTSGNYSIAVEIGGDYSITPIKNTNHLNGVTTYDAVLMTRHILNVELLDSPYKIIAADINNSKTVTTFDIVEMRKLILNIYSNYPNNSSWRFVDADYIFPNPINPWAENFPELINLNNLNISYLKGDFIGIKIGDLNGSANPKN